MQVGLALPHYDCSFPDGRPATFDRVAAYAERAEALGFSQVWMSDHFWIDLERYDGPAGHQGTPECWTTLSGIAMRTERVRLGTLVLAAGFRHPGLLAKMAATLDQLSDGRLDLGLGAGWNAQEFIEHGLDFPAPRQRLAMLEEALGVLAALFGGGPASYAGRWFTLRDAPLNPAPLQRPRPPLWVGGKGDQLLGVVARAADGWNLCWSTTPEQYAGRLDVLRDACARADRPFADVRRSLGLATLIGRDADDLARRWRRLQAWTPGGALDGVPLSEWAAARLVGTPAQILDQLRSWERLGVEQVICTFAGLPFGVFEDEQLDLVAELVLPRLQADAPAGARPRAEGP